MLQGKGMFVWIVKDCEKGNVQEIVNQAQAAGLKHLLVKIADGTGQFNVVQGNVDLAANLVEVARAAGIEVWGWQYVYGMYPGTEARTVLRRIRETGVAGLVVNAEKEYKKAGSAARARQYMVELRNDMPALKIGLSSYRYPQLHPELPWAQFLGMGDFAMPQVYWMGVNGAEQARKQLRDTLKSYAGLYQKLGFERPIIPTGAAFAEHGWKAQPEEVTALLMEAEAQGLPAANFWEWGRTRRDCPECWTALAGYPWANIVQEPDAPQSPVKRVRVTTDECNIRNAPQIARISDIGNLHLNAELEVIGEQEGWYKVQAWVSRSVVREV